MFPLAAALVMLTSHCDASRDRPGIREHHPVCYVTEDQPTPFMVNRSGGPLVVFTKPNPDPKPAPRPDPMP